MPRRTARSLAVVAAVALVAGCSDDGDSGVETAQVGRATVAEVVEAPGTVVARASGQVQAPATGTLDLLRVRDGQSVQAGQVLLRVDSPQAVRALAQAREADRDAADAASSAAAAVPQTEVDDGGATDDAASAAFEAARQAAEAIPDPTARAQALAAATAAEAQYAAARAQAQAAVRNLNDGLGSLSQALTAIGEAQRVQTRAAVDLAEANVEALTVRAPVSGVVAFGGAAAEPTGDLSGALSQVPDSLRGAASSALGGAQGSASVSGALEVGSPVSSGQTLLTVTDTSGLSLTAEVDETDVLLVKEGTRAGVDLDAVPGASYRAGVRAIDPAPTAGGGGNITYVVRMTLEGGTLPDGSAAPTPRPGMSAVVDLEVRTAEDAVSVPASAVFRDGDRDAVWVSDGGRARKVSVDVGAQGEELVEIRSGLDVGTTVVVAGADDVTEGMQLP